MEESEPQLTKRERRELAKQMKWEEKEKKGTTRKLRNSFFGLFVVIGLLSGGYWLYRQVSKPLPGQAVESMGQEHVTDISNVTYNSNPPTSGPHFDVWAKKGVYDRVLSDGYLIHSLEHGYIVISYNCSQNSKFKNQSSKLQIKNQKLLGQLLDFSVQAHETDEPHEEPLGENVATGESKPLTRMTVQPTGKMSWFTPDNPPEDEVGLPNEFNSEDCKKLIEDLRSLLKEAERIIIVPRPSLDTQIALTAWGRIDRMDDFDKERIKRFISSFHNRGPEKTAE